MIFDKSFMFKTLYFRNNNSDLLILHLDLHNMLTYITNKIKNNI